MLAGITLITLITLLPVMVGYLLKEKRRSGRNAFG
jgi:hypothetical protein